MSAPQGHIHITEREPDGSWEDCTWVAGLEWYRLAYDPEQPASHAEAQALRDASGKGPTGGSNYTDFKRGVAARYHVDITVPQLTSFSALWNALKPGHVAAISGSMVAFGPTSPYSKYDPHFDGGHAVFVARMDTQDRVWWCDPEAPLGIGYSGAWMSKADLQRFVNAFGGTHLVAPLLAHAAPQESTMDTLVSSTPGSLATVKPQSNVRVAPHIAATKVRTTASTEVHALVGTVAGDIDPANGSNVWYVWYEQVGTGFQARYTAKDNVTNVANPSTVVGATVAQVNEAVARAVAAQKSADDVAKAAAVKQAEADATMMEKARVAAVLGV